MSKDVHYTRPRMIGQEDNRRIYIAGGLVGMLAGSAIALSMISIAAFFYPEQLWESEDFVLLIVANILGLIGGLYFARGTASARRSIEKVEYAEAKLNESPNDETLIWRVARAQIELYVDRNQSQQRNIYFLTVVVIIIGFLLIVAGIMLAFVERLQPAILAVVSGLLVDFVGATFLLIYKSTISQSRNFVDVLERINAVGMALQILDKIEGQTDLRDKTRARVSISLLNLYASKENRDK